MLGLQLGLLGNARIAEWNSYVYNSLQSIVNKLRVIFKLKSSLLYCR